MGIRLILGPEGVGRKWDGKRGAGDREQGKKQGFRVQNLNSGLKYESGILYPEP